MINEKELTQVVTILCNVAYSDSRVELDAQVLEQTLRTDFGVSVRLLTEKECEEFIMGDDEGEVPEELKKLFPQTDEFLASYW